MSDYPFPILTVDVVLMALRKDGLWLGLIRRAAAPFAGAMSLPGGFVHVNEDKDTEATALRVIREKTGLTDVHCEQLGTFSGATRDPRGWSATVVYFALVRGEPPEGEALTWVPAAETGDLAFDHSKIVSGALARLRAKGSWSSLPAFFLPELFTFSELRRTYEQVLEAELNDSAFRRKVDELDLIEAVEGQKSKSTARPAQLFRLKGGKLRAFDRRI